MFFEDKDEYTYLWTNKLEEDFVQMDITVFEQVGDLYKREDESHIQYIHNVNEVRDLLIKCGFEVQIFDGEKFIELTDISMRVLFICKKVR